MSIVNQAIRELKITTAMVYAGGTISSRMTNHGYRTGGYPIDFANEVTKRIPYISNKFKITRTETAYTGLSENIDHDYWTGIVKAIRSTFEANPKAIIVTYGTDSMEQFGRFLQEELGETLTQKGTQIILTGANKDLSNFSTDAWENLNFAFESITKNKIPGVFIAFHRKFIPAEFVVKEPFNGIEMNYASSNDHKYHNALQSHNKQAEKIIAELRTKLAIKAEATGHVIEYPVNVVRRNHQDFHNHVKYKNIKAVLLVLYHSGTANTEKPNLSVAKLVNNLRTNMQIVFFGVTENDEPTDLHYSYETSIKLKDAGVVPLYNMNKAVALAKLQIVAHNTPTRIIDDMLINNVGEIDKTKIIPEDIEKLKKLYL